MTQPTLHVRTPAGPVRGVAIVLHGGRSRSLMRTRPWQLAVLRMVPFASALRRAGAADGLAVARLRFRVRGWNGPDQSPVADARWALEQLRRRFPDVPVALVGHSMGGRTALAVADDPAVRVVVALAPWIEPGDPVEPIRGRRVLLLHGTRDRMTSAARSAALAQHARGIAAQVSYLSVQGGSHAMLRRAAVWHDLAAGFVVGALWDAARSTPVSRSGGTGKARVTNGLREALAGTASLVV